MKNKRRDFIKLTSLAGLGIAGSSILQGSASKPDIQKKPVAEQSGKQNEKQHVQRFNMSGFAAPKLSTVGVGIIGLGGRGPGHLNSLIRIEGVEIKALCDLRPERAEAAKKTAVGAGHNPVIYSGNKDEWKKLCEQKDIDLVVVTTPWYLHAEMVVYAMNHGKHAASEVNVAATIEECWEVIETAEKTRKHCFMMGNACYGDFQMLTLNMARMGFFGEIIHGECAYIANKMKNNFSKNTYWDMWWLKQYGTRKGNIYPVHYFGTVCQIMDINRGDKLDYLVSVESKDFQMAAMAKKLAETDEFFKPFADKEYRGNINTSIIKTNKGRTIMVQHDATTFRPHSYIQGIYGTNGSALEYPLPPRISKGGEDWVSPEEYKMLEEKYTPPIVAKIGEMAKQVGGHGGMDFIMQWRFIDCLHNGLPLDQDVYDGVAWSSIIPLSSWSVNNHSNSIAVPDFTAVAWKTNKRNMDLTVAEGGNTKIKKIG
jgi:predicted dehydrogenase